MAVGEPSGEVLTPYVPRLVVQWAREAPGERVRELSGTLAFVDISGFTAMSERLSSRGKAGAEEVTGVMNATFARLLEVAYGFGGGLLKFGGDALLLFFDGDGHAGRAAAAAYGMRAALEEIGRPETSAGPVELRMHVGLHTDAFRFFLVGDAHLELIVAGPAASRTVLMEATAEAGEILLSDAAAAAVEPHVLGERKGEGVLLVAPPEAESRLDPLPETGGLDLERFVPVEVRAQVAVAAEAEHRAATVAFVHAGGLDALEPAAAAEALDELVRSVQAAAGKHGVCFLETDIDGDGTKIVLTAGAPRASENDEERMLRTVRAVVEARQPLPVRVGVSRGRVFAGEVGAPFRRTYTILGDTAALAARLMARAEPGRVLATVDVVERSRTEFESAELEPFQVKGKGAPVRAVELGPVKGTRELGARRRLPLVDRERELAVLDAALGPVRMGFGSLVELVGEPGIGKSRIVEEVADRVEGMRRLLAPCEQYEATTPYRPFRGALREALGLELDGTPDENTERLRRRLEQTAPELLPWIPLLALPLDVEVLATPEVNELQPAFRRARLHGAVASLLGSVLAGPTLLLFEDVHWMDEASSELLRHLASQISSRPWFACATRRPVEGGFSAAEGVPPVPALTLRLEPLPRDDARKLVAAVAGDALPPEEIEAITERAGGNPLFLQELAGAEAEAVELPESVEAMVAAKIDRLAPQDRALLRWASVLGLAFPGDLIAEVLRGDPSAAADSEAWDRVAEFVERDPDLAGGFRFRHALIRDAAYEGLSYARREELHARIGEVLEARHGEQAEEHAELLSLHFSLGRVADRAWRYSLVAGERAKAKHANVDAAEFYRRALDAAADLPELEPAAVGGVWESLAEVSLLAGRLAEAASALVRARRLAAPLSQAPLALKEGRLREEMGLYSDAIHWLGRGFRELEHIPDEARRAHWRLELTVAYTQARFRQGRFDDCIRLCEGIVEEAQRLGDLRSLAHAYYLLHVVHTILGNPERTAFRGLALPIYEEVGDLVGQANVLNNLGVEAYYEGRWDDARDRYERSLALRERVGDVTNAAVQQNNVGEILSDQGRLDEAVRLFEEALQTGEAAGHGLLVAMVTGNLGRAAARGGRFEEAERLLGRAFEALRDMTSPFAVEMLARRAELLVLRGGRHDEALTLAAEALAQEAPAAVTAMLHRIRGHALVQAGDAAAARDAFEESLRVAREAGADYEAALTLAGLGRRAESDEILSRLGVVSIPHVPGSEG